MMKTKALMNRPTKWLMAALPAIACIALAFGPTQAAAQQGSSATLKVKVNYTGAGTVDEKHKIVVFFFDSPEFTTGQAMPIAMKPLFSKNGAVTFDGSDKQTIYVATVFDPTGAYDGESGPPPSGSSLGMYMTAPPAPAGVALKAGSTSEVEVAFDDSSKMP